MNKLIKTLLTIIGVLLVLGIVAGCICFFWLDLGGEDFQKRTMTYQGDYSCIKADTDTTDINIHTVSGDEIIVTYYDSDRSVYSLSDDGGVLSITREDSRPWYLRLWWFPTTTKYTLELGIPASFGGALDLETTTGDLELSGLDIAEGVKIDMTTGNVKLSELAIGGDLELEHTTGNTKLDAVSVSGDLETHYTTGGLKFDDLSVGGTAEMSGTTGNIKGSGLRCTALEAGNTTGSIKIDDIDASSSIRIKTTTGSVDCSVPDAIGSYTIQSDTSTGSNELPESLEGGSKQLEVETSTGSIDFSFGG